MIGKTVRVKFGIASADFGYDEGAIVVVNERNANFLSSALRGGCVELLGDIDEVKIPEVKSENIDLLPNVPSRTRGRKRTIESEGGL